MSEPPPPWTRRRFLQSTALAGPAVFFSSPPGPTQQLPAQPLPQIASAHPRLHFDADGRQQLRERAADSHRRYAQLLFDWTDKHRDWSPPTDVPDDELGEVMLEESAAFVTNAALAYVLSQKPEHRRLARRWTLALSEVPEEPINEYALGVYAAGLARAYDWLYDEWSDAERRQLRDHIARLTRHVYQGSFANNEDQRQWWAGAHLHHDFWIPVGGFGEAALALAGEVDEAKQWAARARQQFEVIFSWIGEDGAWHEGAADWCYALAPLLWFYGAWQSATGENLHEDRPWLRRTAAYRLYHWLPDNTYVYLNDSFRSGRYNTSGSASCHLLRRLASLFDDSRAQWLAERDEVYDLEGGPQGVYQAPYGGSSYQAERNQYPHPPSQCMAWNMLWYDPTVEATPPADQPGSRHFENLDLAVFRSGWDDEATVASFACGPLGGHRCAERLRNGATRSSSNFTHAHADYNSLTLFVRGQYVIVPSGYARRSSRFQNTVAVNGADLRPDPALDVCIEATAQGPDFDYAAGNATAAFLSALNVEHYRRQLVLLDGCFILHDDLRLDRRANWPHRPWNQFQWTLHSDPRKHALTTDGRAAAWRSHDAETPLLTLDVLEPDHFAWERGTLASQDDVPMLEALRLVRPEWRAPRMRVTAVLSWDDDPVRPKLVRREQWRGITWPGRPDRPAVVFAQDAVDRASFQRQVADAELGGPLLLFSPDADDREQYLRLDADGTISDDG